MYDLVRYAPVAPLPVLEALRQENKLGNYLLLLAHDVVKYKKDYAELRAGPWKNTIIILDNSVVELGTAVSREMMVEAHEAVKPQFVVLPDVMHEAAATIEEHRRALAEWPRAWNYMAIPTGRSVAEALSVVEALQHVHGVRLWGIPKLLAEVINRGRFAELVALMDTSSRQIHMLGFADNLLLEDLLSIQACARSLSRRILGVDSAVPVRIGFAGQDLRNALLEDNKIASRGTFWADCEAFEGPLPKEVLRNMDYVRQLVNYGVM